MIALFFDTETTGIKTWKDPNFIPKLVQLGAILQDMETGRVLAEVNLIAHPGDNEIPADAAAVHGITTDLAKQFGLPVEKIDGVFHDLLKQADLLVAHNIDYDMDTMKDNLTYSYMEFEKPLDEFDNRVAGRPQNITPTFCTMNASLYIVKAPLTEKQKAYFSSKGKRPDYPYKSPNLGETYRHFFNEDFVGAHDAMADIRACRDIFLKLIEQGFITKTGEPTGKIDELIKAAA